MKSLELPGVTSIAPGQDIQTNKHPRWHSGLQTVRVASLSDMYVFGLCREARKAPFRNTVIMQTFTMNDNIMKKI